MNLGASDNYWFVKSFLEMCGKNVVFLCGDVSREFCEILASVADSMDLQSRVYEVIKEKELQRIEKIATRGELEKLSARSKVDKEMIESVSGCDAVVWIGLHEDFDVFYLIDKQLADSVLSKSFLLLSFPSRATAVQLGMRYEDYWDIYLKSLNYPWKEMKVLGEGLREKLSMSQTISITSPFGTDLTFKRRGENLNLFYGLIDEEAFSKGRVQLQLPAGELYMELEEPDLNGIAVFDVPRVLNGNIVSKVTITIRNGVVVDFKSQKGEISLMYFFKRDEAITVGELGFGLNPSIRPFGSIYLDEKAYGTMHMGFGGIGTLEHADFVMSNPTVRADGKSIISKEPM